MHLIAFHDLRQVRDGQKTIMFLSPKDLQRWNLRNSIGTLFQAAQYGEQTVLICEILNTVFCHLQDDLSPETLQALGCPGTPPDPDWYKSRWNSVHCPKENFDANPEVLRAQFRFTGKETTRGLSLVEEEDARVFRLLDECAKAITLETDKEVFGSERK